MKSAVFFILCLMLAGPALAQQQFPAGIGKFDARASEVTNVSLDKNMLNFASKFLSSSHEDSEARRIVASLDGIYVRSYDFDKTGAYSSAEVEALRRQFEGPQWSHIISVRGKGSDGDTDIYMHVDGNQIKGMMIIAAEPTELTFVNILGAIKPEEVSELSGEFGIPKIHGHPDKKDAAKEGQPQ